MQVARDMPRSWNLDTPEAQHLLQELTRELQEEDEAAGSKLTWHLSDLDRTDNALYSASPSQSRDAPDEAIDPSIDAGQVPPCNICLAYRTSPRPAFSGLH